MVRPDRSRRRRRSRSTGEVFARGEPYTCQVLVAPGHYPNNGSTEPPPGDFEPVAAGYCDGITSGTDAFDGTLAELNVAALKALLPGAAPTSTAASPATAPADRGNGRPFTAPHGFTVKVVVTDAGPARMTGEDQRARTCTATRTCSTASRGRSGPPTASPRPPSPTSTATTATS